MCPGCLADRARGRGPYPDLTDAELRAGLDLLPTWALAQKAAANRQVIAVMGGRLERGEPVCRCTDPWGWPGGNAKPRSPNSSSVRVQTGALLPLSAPQLPQAFRHQYNTPGPASRGALEPAVTGGCLPAIL